MKRILMLLTALFGIMGLRAEVTFISEVKLATTTTALTNEGYTAINRDLNEGAGGDYIYLGYKTTTDPTQAITNLAIYTGNTYASDNYLTISIYTAINGIVYGFNKAPYTGVGNNGDLNAGAGGDYLYLFYSKTGQHNASVHPITSIAINGSGTQVSSKNLNAGTGSKTADLWLTIEGTHTHNNSGIRNNGDGTHTFYCTDCGAYIGNESDACTLTLSTTTDDDTHTYTCSVCGYATPIAHTFDNGICTYCNAYEKPDYDEVYSCYLLGNAGNALWWNNNVHNQLTPSSVRMTADIDLNPGYVFASDGTYTAPAGAHRLETWSTPAASSSEFRGEKHVLSGLYSVSSDGLAGLCGELSTNGVVRDLIIRDSYVSGGEAGAFAGYLNGGRVHNCGAVNIKGSCTTKYGSVMIGEIRRGTFDSSWSYSPNSGLKNALAYVSGDLTACYIAWCAGLADSGDLDSRFTGYSKAEFASGMAARFANADNSAGSWKQAIGVDSIPSFNGPSVYGVYDAEGNLTACSNRSRGDVTGHGKATVADMADLIDHLKNGYSTYRNADVNGDNTLSLDDATQLREIILGRDPFVEVSSISIEGSAKMASNTTQTLTTTILPADAQIPYLIWTSSADSIVSVTDGTLTALKSGQATITATAVDGSGVTATFVVKVDNSGTIDGHDYVDLCLPSGTLWATTNVGADTPEAYGDYFAWGETTGNNSGKTTYDLSTYTLCNGTNFTMTKYCTWSWYGTVDNKTEIEPADDAAYVNWGSDWRMPTRTQFSELVNSSYTTSTWTTQNGVNGRLITSLTNGNSIFLPAAGDYTNSSVELSSDVGCYWSRTLYSDQPHSAYDLYFISSSVYTAYTANRFRGQSVRPVLNR